MILSKHYEVEIATKNDDYAQNKPYSLFRCENKPQVKNLLSKLVSAVGQHDWADTVLMATVYEVTVEVNMTTHVCTTTRTPITEDF